MNKGILVAQPSDLYNLDDADTFLVVTLPCAKVFSAGQMTVSAGWVAKPPYREFEFVFHKCLSRSTMLLKTGRSCILHLLIVKLPILLFLLLFSTSSLLLPIQLSQEITCTGLINTLILSNLKEPWKAQ